MRRPSDGLLDSPWPMSSGRMMKYLVMSSGWPGPKRTSEKTGLSSEWAPPPVPCSSRTALSAWPSVRPEREVVEVQIGERLAGAEAEVVNVEALVPDGPGSRGVLRLPGRGASGGGEGK